MTKHEKMIGLVREFSKIKQVENVLATLICWIGVSPVGVISRVEAEDLLRRLEEKNRKEQKPK